MVLAAPTSAWRMEREFSSGCARRAWYGGDSHENRTQLIVWMYVDTAKEVGDVDHLKPRR
jgi:hypothetical protein